MARTNQRGRNNNNPEGRNQFSNGWMDSAKDRPFTSAAAAAAAVGAGVFLWSRRNQISDQISNLSGQLYDWADELRAGSSSGELALTEGPDAIEPSHATVSRGGVGTKSSTGSRSTPKARRTTGRVEPQSTVM